MRILIPLVIFFSPLARGADCPFRENYELGRDYGARGQNLLSAFHFSTAQRSTCAELALRSKYDLALALARLEEWSEFDHVTRELSATSLGEPARFLRAVHLAEEAGAAPETLRRAHLWTSLEDAHTARTAWSAAGMEAEILARIEATPRRSPALAAGLNALLPGAGYASLGMWQSAGLSFVLNGLFVASALEFGRKDLHAAEITAYAIGSVTYIGGIIGGHRAAVDWNREAMRPVRDEARARVFTELRER